MGVVEYRIVVDLGAFKRFEKALRSNRGEIRKAYTDWSKYYADFTRRRFRKFSMRRGNWKQLKPATIAAKRRKGSKFATRILMDTRKMYKTLNPHFLRSTAKTRKRRTGISVTYGSRKKYRNGPMVSKVMQWHQKGAGNLPKRRIFINPDKETREKMARRMEKAMQKELDDE